MGGLISRKKN